MTEFLTDLYISMNVYAFVATCVDKASWGKHKKMFWAFTIGFGAVGSAAACLLIRHRTKSGGAGGAILLAVAQFFLFKWLVIG